ncbi:hypothetical protein [Frankia sp. R43]|uniref:hypothetical protein n=1 Tax=Frankia sp. R43 TaxID=269536 RepID=UPI000B029E78|nr:hypothetical protein [Frankia sp. R43]
MALRLTEREAQELSEALGRPELRASSVIGLIRSRRAGTVAVLTRSLARRAGLPATSTTAGALAGALVQQLDAAVSRYLGQGGAAEVRTAAQHRAQGVTLVVRLLPEGDLPDLLRRLPTSRPAGTELAAAVAGAAANAQVSVRPGWRHV